MTALYLTTDLMFSSRVASTAAELSLELSVVSSPQQLLDRVAEGNVHLVVLEFSRPEMPLIELVPRLRESSPVAVRIIAFGPHVDVAGLAGATQAGCDEVYTRGQFNQQLMDILRKHGCTV